MLVIFLSIPCPVYKFLFAVQFNKHKIKCFWILTVLLPTAEDIPNYWTFLYLLFECFTALAGFCVFLGFRHVVNSAWCAQLRRCARADFSFRFRPNPARLQLQFQKPSAENTNPNCCSLWVSMVSLFFPSPFGYKIHTVLCFCPQSRTWSGVLIPSPLRDHSPCISVQGYPTAVQLLEYSFPGRNSINLSWWKRCFWSGTWFTCSFSFRLGEWHLPAGVQTFTFPFPVLKRTEGPVSGDLSSWLAVRFLSAKYYPKESKQNQLTSPKVGAKDLEITLFFCFHWLDNGTSSFFFSPFWRLMPLGLWQIFNICSRMWHFLDTSSSSSPGLSSDGCLTSSNNYISKLSSRHFPSKPSV